MLVLLKQLLFLFLTVDNADTVLFEWHLQFFLSLKKKNPGIQLSVLRQSYLICMATNTHLRVKQISCVEFDLHSVMQDRILYPGILQTLLWSRHR